MKKLYISIPMKGRTEEAIKNSYIQMHKLAEIMFGEPLAVLESYIPEEAPEGVCSALWKLGKSIQKISEADYFIGIGYDDYYKGCGFEWRAAENYGIRSVAIRIEDCSFFKDAIEIRRNWWNNQSCCSVPMEDDGK